tara:strand:+ start:7110 stop:7715 length:606 start_codon:yes stop_codon:yes gene_type:complete
MTEGQNFLDKCLDTPVNLNPWPHQIIDNTLSEETFIKLEAQCKKYLTLETKDLIQIFPGQFKDWDIDFFDEAKDICRNLIDNYKKICGLYPEHRDYSTIGANCHISICPPLPYKFYIHQEGLEKIWSSVTYVSPDINVGTKMYKAQKADAFIKEAEWKANTSFIFCGKQGKTWHSYESNQDTNRITFNIFLMKYRDKCFLR